MKLDNLSAIWHNSARMLGKGHKYRESSDFPRVITTLSDVELVELDQSLRTQTEQLSRRESRAAVAAIAGPLIALATTIGTAPFSLLIAASVVTYGFVPVVLEEAIAIGVFLSTARHSDHVADQWRQVNLALARRKHPF